MKNLTSAVLIIFLSSCSSGGGSSGPACMAPISTLLPADLANMTVGQTYKADTCFPESGGRSSRKYIVKLDVNAETFKVESDLFSGASCEQGAPPIIMTEHRSFKLKSYHDSAATTGYYTLVFEQQDVGFTIYDQQTVDDLNLTNQLIQNGSWVLNQYKSIAGLSVYYPANGNLTSHEFNYNIGLVSLDSNQYQ